MSNPRLVWATCELSVLALVLGAAVMGVPRPAPVTPPLRHVQVPLLPAPDALPMQPSEGPLELRTLVLHPDVEESFPARGCEAQGLPEDENDCDVPPLMT